jgi:Ca2+-binding EF-hand superfamily protein
VGCSISPTNSKYPLLTQATDYERTHLISAEKLTPCLRNLSPASIEKIITHFGPDTNKEINYAELIYGLKGNMSTQRQPLVDDLFSMLDTEQRGEVEIMRLIAAHKNRTDLGSFKRSVDLYCKFQSIEDGIFTDEDFTDFFEFLSFTFVNDADFSEWLKARFYC